jgi:hypothetical protein
MPIDLTGVNLAFLESLYSICGEPIFWEPIPLIKKQRVPSQ